jgi:hypothetical protein
VFVGDPMADRLDGLVGAIGGGTHVGGRRLQRSVPQVVASPPLHLVEDARVDTAVEHRRGAQRELALVVLRLGVGDAVGQVPITDAFELQRRSTGGARGVDRVGGEVKEHLARKNVVSRAQGCQPSCEVTHIVDRARRSG